MIAKLSEGIFDKQAKLCSIQFDCDDGRSIIQNPSLLHVYMHNSHNSTSDNISPEEEPLFLEFQQYTRSIFTEASNSVTKEMRVAATKISEGINSLYEETSHLKNTVQQSRNEYSDLFRPAILDLEQKVELLVNGNSQTANEAFQSSTRSLQEQFLKMQSEIRTEVAADLNKKWHITLGLLVFIQLSLLGIIALILLK